MDLRLGIGLAAAGVAGMGTIGANHLLNNRREDSMGDPVSVRRDRAQHQRPGGLKLEYVARSGSPITDWFGHADSFAQGGAVVFGISAIAGGVTAVVKGSARIRTLGAAGLGITAGIAAGAIGSALLARGKELSVQDAAADIMAVADVDADGGIQLGRPSNAGPTTADDAEKSWDENQFIQRLHYHDPMDFIGTQGPTILRHGDRLQPFDSNSNDRLEASEVRSMTASFDEDGNGKLSHGVAANMAAELNLQTWKGAKLTGLDKSSWRQSDYFKDGYR